MRDCPQCLEAWEAPHGGICTDCLDRFNQFIRNAGLPTDHKLAGLGRHLIAIDGYTCWLDGPDTVRFCYFGTETVFTIQVTT